MIETKESKFNIIAFFLMFVASYLICFVTDIREALAADCHVALTLEVTEGDPYLVRGRVTGVPTDDVRVVVFVRTDKWYIQPYADARAYLTVATDGSYETWIRDWRQISAFVIREGYNALANIQAYRPLPLTTDCVDVLAVEAYPAIQFSGYKWAIKGGDFLGPGPNYFAANEDNVWVDDKGHLHLKIMQREGKWCCAEVYLMNSLGYGTYNFQLSSRVDLLDKNVVGSPFVYKDDTHEMDVEFSTWGTGEGPNAQFVVQPYYNAGNREQYSMSLSNDYSTHIINWKPEAVSFQSYSGNYLDPPPGMLIHQWQYIGPDTPLESDELVHINMWLLNGQAPSDGKTAEMVIKSFYFYENDCMPPLLGDWIVLGNCTLIRFAAVSGNVSIEDGAVVTIAQDAELFIQ